MKEKLLKIESLILLLLGLGMTLIMFVNATGRYTLGNTFLWAEEVIRILFVWGMFIAITELFINDGHIGFCVIKNKNKYTLATSNLIKNIVLIALGINLVWFGVQIIQTIGKVPLPATKLPNSIFFYPGIISGGVWTIIGTYKLIESLLAKRRGE